MPESPIRKLTPYADAAKARGINVYHLNIGQPDIKTPVIAIDAVKNSDVDILEYGKSQGSEKYRRKLVAYYDRHQIKVKEDEIAVTIGASEALSFTLASITNPGDEVIIPEPFYANYIGFATASSVNVIPVVSDFEKDFSLPEISEFEKLITERSKAILICNPGNPTGYLYSKDEIESLARIVKKHDIFLIVDEVYREFVYDGAEHFSAMQVKGIEEHAIVIDSVSKRYSMCGARVGCIISKHKNFMAVVLKFLQARLSPPTYGMIASEAALDTPQSYFDNVKEEYLNRRDTLVEGLSAIEGVKVSKPKGAFYCIAELPIKNTDKFAKWMLEKFDYEGSTIMIAPASGFYSTKGMGKNQVRIAYVLNIETLKRCVEILKLGIEAYQKALA